MQRLTPRADTNLPGAQPPDSAAGPDLLIPATLMAAIALILPPLQTQAWWLILPCLICLILRWHSIAFVLLFASITYADSWWTGGYFLGLTVLLMMRMHSNPGAGNRARLVSVLRQLVLAAPILLIILALMLAAGARWSSRDTGNRAATGISETMTPGTVSELINDSNLAMRVRFSDNPEPLPAQDLYWRGIVMEDFDGRSWSRHNRLDFDLDPVPANVNMQDRLSYLVTLEPSRQFWLYGLHQAYATRPQTFRDTRGMLITSDMVRQRVRYPVTSIVPPAEQSLSEESRQRNLAIPADSNPQTRQWVNELRRNHNDDRAFAQAVLQHFNQQEYYYTLTPELSSQHSVDDLMFNNREGYCEHYASAMTFILRAAGIPARVVAGYQSGEFNPITGHWTVYQYNAHAWTEAWFPDSGWQRLDATAAIAPERIQSGIDAWLAALNSNELNELDRDTRLRLQLAAIPGYQSARSTLDALQYGWNLSMYDNEGNLRTEDLSAWLDRQGLGNLPVWLLALLLVAVGVRAMWGSQRERQRLSPAMRVYLRLDARLRKQGLGRRPGETITAHLGRVGAMVPEDGSRWRELSRTLTEAEYGAGESVGRDIRAEIRELVKRMGRFGQLAD